MWDAYYRCVAVYKQKRLQKSRQQRRITRCTWKDGAEENTNAWPEVRARPRCIQLLASHFTRRCVRVDDVETKKATHCCRQSFTRIVTVTTVVTTETVLRLSFVIPIKMRHCRTQNSQTSHSMRDCATAPAPTPFGLTVNFWIILGTVFVSFVSWLNRKIRVPRLLPVKNWSKCTQSYHFGDKNIFFLRSVPVSSTTPWASTPTAPRPLVTEILNTLLAIQFAAESIPSTPIFTAVRFFGRPQ